MARIHSYNHWLEIADKIQQEVDEAGLGWPRPKPDQSAGDERSPLDRFDEVVTIPVLRKAIRKLFADGHYARAVEGAFKCLNNAVKKKSGLTTKDGAALMKEAFSAKSPVLKLNEFLSDSEKNEQLGYMEMFAGTMTGIRNPRAHEHELDDEPEVRLRNACPS